MIITIQYLCLWTANNALIFAVFFLIFVAYHVTFYSVVKTPTLPQVVFKGTISGLRPFLAAESPLKTMKNAFISPKKHSRSQHI